MRVCLPLGGDGFDSSDIRLFGAPVVRWVQKANLDNILTPATIRLLAMAPPRNGRGRGTFVTALRKMASKVPVRVFDFRHAAPDCMGPTMTSATVVESESAGRRRRFSRTDYGPARLSGSGVLHRVPS